MNRRYSAREVAHHIVDLCARESEPVSNLQLQKILYFVQQQYARETGGLLFDDSFEAWQYGPVQPGVYREYASLGGAKIRKVYGGSVLASDATASCVVDSVTRRWRSQNPWRLVDATHVKGSPWDRTYRGGLGNHHVIDNAYFLDNAAV